MAASALTRRRRALPVVTSSVLGVIVWAGAAVWSAGLIAFAFAPMYSTVGSSSSGRTVRGTETLIGENGNAVLVVLAVPLAVTLLVGLALLLRSHRAALVIAWGLTVLLGVFNLLAMLSIGLLIVPVTAALALACLASSGAVGAPAAPDAPTGP